MSAHWMTGAQAQAFGLFDGRNAQGVIDAMLIGASDKEGRYLWYRGDGHTMIVSPPGGGKGQGFVVPNCVLYPGSMLVVDPKGENAAMTADHRRDNLKHAVHVIDPFGLSGHRSASFNPLDWLRTTEPKYFYDDCDLLARALIAPEAAQHKHFYEEAVNLMRGLIVYLFAHEPNRLNLNRLYDLACGDYRYWAAVFELLAASDAAHEGIRRIARSAGNLFLGLYDDARDQHRNTVQKNLRWLGGMALPPVVETSDFDLKTLKVQPTTIYLCIPGESRELYKPYVRCLVTLSLLGMYRTQGLGDLPVQFMCDEYYTTIGSIEIVDAAVGDMRGYGARFAFAFQDISQLKKLYPDTWPLFESSCGAVIYIGAEGETAEHVSKRLGTRDYIERRGGTFSTGDDVVSRPDQMGQKPLLTPQQVAQLGPLKEIVFLQHKPPLVCDRVTAGEDTNFKRFLRDNPTRHRALGTSQSDSALLSDKPMRTVDDYLAERDKEKRKPPSFDDALRELRESNEDGD